jgi:hypothetical protein
MASHTPEDVRALVAALARLMDQGLLPSPIQVPQ